MVNVIWINETEEEYYQEYEKFIQLYNENKINITELRKQLNLSQTKYHRYHEKALKENRLISKRRAPQKPRLHGRTGSGKYYTKTKQGFLITKKLGTKTFTYGTYESEELTQKIIQELKKIKWNKKYLPHIQQKLAEESL